MWLWTTYKRVVDPGSYQEAVLIADVDFIILRFS